MDVQVAAQQASSTSHPQFKSISQFEPPAKIIRASSTAVAVEPKSSSSESEAFCNNSFQLADSIEHDVIDVHHVFDIPKFPIEKKQFAHHLLELQSLRCSHDGSGASALSHVNPAENTAELSLFKSTSIEGSGKRIAFPNLLDMDSLMQVDKASAPELMLDAQFSVNFQRINITGDQTLGVPVEDLLDAAQALLTMMQLRMKYMEKAQQEFNTTASHYINMANSCEVVSWPEHTTMHLFCKEDDDLSYHAPPVQGDPFHIQTPLPPPLKGQLRFDEGVMQLYESDTSTEPLFDFAWIRRKEFIQDYNTVLKHTMHGPLKSFCFRRLEYLNSHHQLHTLLNEFREAAEQRLVPHRDFYNIRKVDTHIHAASCMNQKHLLRFIKKRVKAEPDTPVCIDKVSGKELSLKQLFDSIGISTYDLSIDMLDVHADRNTFHRFDKFNAKYNPIGQSQLRDLFLKTENHIKGRFFAHVIKEVCQDLEESKYQNSEPRLSIYGRQISEWDNLAEWVVDHNIYSDNVRWLIQVPRLYDIYKENLMVDSFEDFLRNVFQPLFEVTLDPASHPKLHSFLQYVTAFDSVDDESKHEAMAFDFDCPTPQNWRLRTNPPYSYYLYYMYANISVLNHLRRHRGMNTFTLRPHCGEAGPINHLVSAFLLALNINHGLLLRKAPVLQYLYYLCQIGLAMSPLSNNHLFLNYHRNPLPDFHAKGLLISLSTDDPLQFHFTKEPLMEEYSIATQVWKLSQTDMSELARNSVQMSGFPHSVKEHWLGRCYKSPGVAGNDISRTNVPNIRVAYRHEALCGELDLLARAVSVANKMQNL